MCITMHFMLQHYVINIAPCINQSECLQMIGNVQEFEKVDNKKFRIEFLEFIKRTKNLFFHSNLHLSQIPHIPNTYLAS